MSKPYRVPLVEIEGPVAFRGKAPSRLDVQPLVFDPITATYRPAVIVPNLVHIPREATGGSDIIFGKVLDALGTVEHHSFGDNPDAMFRSLDGLYKVQLYPDGPRDKPGEIVAVQVFYPPMQNPKSFGFYQYEGVNDPYNNWIGPVFQGADGKYYSAEG